MDGTADDGFLAQADENGIPLLHLHFRPQERTEILRMAAGLKLTPEQLIQAIIRQRLPVRAGAAKTERSRFRL